MQISRFEHPNFTSNTYLLQHHLRKDAWLIDAGYIDEIVELANINIKGVFLTHAHYDHIFGLNQIIERFPSCIIYASDYTLKSLKDPKQNLSFYHEKPIVVEHEAIHELMEGRMVKLSDEHSIEVIETPGHNPGCLSFILGNVLFSGDSFIPGFPVITKLKGGNRLENQQSLIRIEEHINSGKDIYPGHKEIYPNKALQKLKPIK